MNLEETVRWMCREGIVTGSVRAALEDQLPETGSDWQLENQQYVSTARDDVRRVIERLRLGETFDFYRARHDDEEDQRALAIVIADAFMEVADWDEADRLEKATQA